MRNFYKKNKQETYLILTIILIGLLIGIKNPVFFTASNFAGILRNLIIDGMMAYAIMLGIIIGGIDVSFPAIAVCSMYITNRFAQSVDYSGPVILLFLMAMGIGLLLGLLNGFLITKFKLPAFVVTLGTSSAFYGLLISVLGGSQVNRLVEPLESVSKFRLWVVTSSSSQTIIPVTFIFMLVIMALTWFILNKTMLGRMIYAIGGDRTAAERVGFPVNKIIIFVYAYIGLISGLAGLSHSIQTRCCIPTDLMGGEMTIIAMVVLGGTKISGGRGTVLGTFLGLFLITMVKSCLILVGIPSTWQTLVIGIVIVIGTGISSYQVLKDQRKIAPVLENDE